MNNKAKNHFMIAFMMLLGFIGSTAGPLTSTANAAVETPVITLDNQCTVTGGCGMYGLAGNVTIGWSFSTQLDVRVSALGIFDDYFFSGQDQNWLGLKESHQVGIWDISGNLVVSTMIPLGTNTTAIGAFRYLSINPITLPANNTFRIGAFYAGPQDSMVRYNQGIWFTVDPAIQLLMSGSASGFSAPILNPSPYSSYMPYGPSFLIAQTYEEFIPIAASSSVNSGDATKTIDNRTDTYWQAADDPEACITFDLGMPKMIGGIKETSGSFPVNPFRVLTSEDGTNFSSKLFGETQTHSSFGGHYFPSPIDARYIQMCIQRTDSGGFGELVEFRALLVATSNEAPLANAGENVRITSQAQCNTTLTGTASDPDGDPLTYQWLKGSTVLETGTVVDGQANLVLCSGVSLGFGEHNLTLKVSDGQEEASDTMILMIDNSAPTAAPTGAGTYALGDLITLGGQVSDFDNDPLAYSWSASSACNGTVQAASGSLSGTPVPLPDCVIPSSLLGLGTHQATLTVSDGVNDLVSSSVEVTVKDDTTPTLAPEPDKSILWPPNHKMVNITIQANAEDNSGIPPTLSATVASNEPQDGLGDGDTAPDWTTPVINQATGEINLQLRAERSGSGDSRVYTIAITATDASGNSSTAPVEIIVPHDKGKK